MQNQEARELLNARAKAGAKLVEVQRGDLQAIKQLQARCHAAGVPTMLGPGTSGG